jgi:hypothetical protein
MLARKLGQIIGFHFEPHEFSELNSEQERVFNPQLLVSLMRENGMEPHLIQEAEQAIEKSARVHDEQGLMEFFRRDCSLIQDNKGTGTIYAVDIDNAPEMNLVERVFRTRDILLDKGELQIILPEEELKKHQKDPKMNHNEITMYVTGKANPPNSTIGNDTTKALGESRLNKLPSPDRRITVS